MDKKVILISIDGMRPDGLQQCGNPFVKELEQKCAYTYQGRSVFPSVTFPCHFSMTHSVTPQRHGLLSNTYVPQVRPVTGLFETLNRKKSVNAMFYGWEELRDIAPPGALTYATYQHSYSEEYTDTLLTDAALDCIEKHHPDFVFLYMVETDEKGGHDNGWMSEEYLRRISIAIDNVKRVFDACQEEYSIIIMADHGGSGRGHGQDIPEHMTIPFFFYGTDFEGGKVLEDVSLLEIAPTIVKVMGVEADPEWEGHPVF